MSRYLNQLLALVAIAEQRPLTEAEAGQLRTQLRALAVHRQQAGGLQRGLLETRRERDYLAHSLGVLTGVEPKEIELEARAHVQRQARQSLRGPSAPVSRPGSAPTDSRPSGLENASEAHSAANRPKNQTKAA
ncbi:hypothetical protein ACFWIB_14550 [Streptomyces sp. NPDC127051]|uniref:hypothetical protein n=1 Tax=Streptomyces sp. NPDC127051 TaxID=3347119 RepID=UPI0036617924